jgi:hypothetical protein
MRFVSRQYPGSGPRPNVRVSSDLSGAGRFVDRDDPAGQTREKHRLRQRTVAEPTPIAQPKQMNEVSRLTDLSLQKPGYFKAPKTSPHPHFRPESGGFGRTAFPFPAPGKRGSERPSDRAASLGSLWSFPTGHAVSLEQVFQIIQGGYGQRPRAQFG